MIKWWWLILYLIIGLIKAWWMHSLFNIWKQPRSHFIFISFLSHYLISSFFVFLLISLFLCSVETLDCLETQNWNSTTSDEEVFEISWYLMWNNGWCWLGWWRIFFFFFWWWYYSWKSPSYHPFKFSHLIIQ